METCDIQGKLVFDASEEHLNCVLEHEDYIAMTNRAVLENVAPLLTGKSGHIQTTRGCYAKRVSVETNT